MNNPMVTIGLTCFNAEKTIRRAISSALNQSWPQCELIVVDDCSSDGSVQLVESMIEDKDDASLIKHDINRGAAAARNTILNNAGGDYVIFFDDDDESFPDRVKVQLEALQSYENFSASTLIANYAGGERHYPNGYVKLLPAIGAGQNDPPKGEDIADYLLFYRINKELFYGSGTPSCALMASLQTFKQIGGFDENLRRVEDIDFAVRLALAGGYFTGTREKLFIQFATDSPDKKPEENLKAEQQLVKKHKRYLKTKNRYYYAYHWPSLRYYHFKRQYVCFFVTFFRIFLRYPVVSLNHLFITGTRRLRHELNMSR